MWFRIDDGFAFHPKALSAGNAALGLWVRAGAWAAGSATDGVVPASLVRRLGTPNQAQKLTDSGLWIADGAGYRFHDWEDRNPTAEQLKRLREANAERQRRHRS